MCHPRTQEVRVRNAARRRGYTVSKTARRDPAAADYGLWRLLNPRGVVLFVTHDLNDLEGVLNDLDATTPAR